MGKEQLPTSSNHAILVAVATGFTVAVDSLLCSSYLQLSILPHITSLHDVDFVLCCGVQKYTLALQ